MPGNSFFRYSLGVVLTVFVAILVLVWFGITSKSHVKDLEEHWSIDSELAAESAYTISRIHKSFGYGGFIHNFKNFVLRHDTSRIAIIDQNLSETYEAIERYKALAISGDERAAIVQFRQVVDLYVKKYELTKQLVEQGVSSDLIDKQVRVDDQPALQALEQLSKETLNYSRAVENEVDQDITMALAFLDWGWLLIPLFVSVGGVVIAMLFRLTQGNAALQNAKQYVDDVIKAAPDALIVVNKDGEILSANIEAQSLFGYSHDELTSIKLELLIPERFRKQHHSYLKHAFELGQSQPINERRELLALTKQGEEIPVEISISYTLQNGEVQSIAAIRDISARKQTERSLRLARKVLDEASGGILITDSGTNIIDMNAAFCQVTGYDREELLGQQPSMLSSGRHDQAFYQQMWHDLNNYGQWKGEVWDRRKDGELIPNLVSISAVADEDGQVSHYVAVFSDITQLKEKEQRLEQLAHFDQLTGLANRMLFHDRLRAALRRAHRHDQYCAVLYIDLDGFKQVNDNLGHEVGDEVLIKVARKITHVIREDDTAARIGGDEFAIIFNELQACKEAEVLAARLLEELSFEVNAEVEALPMSASIGIAIYPDHGDTVERLLRCADQAMYYCKHHGKKSYRCFSEEMVALAGTGNTKT